ncbi:C25 family cysteine peptidase [Dyadobacter sp. NIV53]|uniref:putative type IX secretion system sortase PorU2 n=1 Tax=Dyadobacter sp. NIV53 TaxID=2861765 RepID=UPI001E3CBB7D|nr:C25 family cysteine peptidase [Dyadobacter sp. NIV53]
MLEKNRKYENVWFKRIIRTKIHPIIYYSGFVLFIFFFNFSVAAQTVHGDEWINTNQTYLRIPVTQTGFYKLTSQELEATGLPVSEISAVSFQMFRRGKELSIEANSDESGKLGVNGYISFYGERNDGTLDSSLYLRPAIMPHTYYSLYSDTAAYFLTWRQDGKSGKRITKSLPNSGVKVLNYHFEEVSQLFNSNYFTGNFYPTGSNFDTGSVLSNYDNGEGWTGKDLNNAWQIIDINTVNPAYDYFGQTEVELVFAGRSAGTHEIELQAGKTGESGRNITKLTIQDYNSLTYRFLLKREDITANGKIAISIHAVEKTGSISVSHVKWRYPQKSIFPANNNQKIFHFGNNTETSLWEIGNVENRKFYDCSDPYNLKEPEQTDHYISVNGSTRIIGYKEPLKINKPRLVQFKSLDTLQTDYLIITHPLVRKRIDGVDPVEAYAAYRASREGGGYRPFIIESEEVFDRFNYGEPGPSGIRNMIGRMFNAGQLKFVFIIGRSIDPQTARKMGNARSVDMIPNAGWPGSDLALSMGIEGADTFVPLVPVGRINALNSENVRTYLQKVKAMEAEPASAPWRKNILHLSGGRSRDELAAFRGYVKSFESKVAGSSLNARVQTISKKTDAEVEQFPINVPVNKGIALLTLFGHSGLDVTDIDIGFVSDDKRGYQNHPFYPAVIANGCALGSVFYSTKTISTDWIFSPKNGAVLFLAHTFNGISSSLKHCTDSFYEVLADPQFVSEPFGTIQQEAIRRNMLKHPNLSNGITAQQMNLHGDPAIRIFPALLPDYTFDSTSIKFSDPSGNKLSIWSDSILIHVGVVNNGRFRKENYEVLLKSYGTSSVPFIIRSSHKSVAKPDTLTFKMANPFARSGTFSWEITIDPENKLSEENESNNVFSKQMFLPEGGAFPLLPLPGYVTSSRETDLVAQIPFERNNKEVVFEWDTTSSFTNAQKIIAPVNNFIASHKILIPDTRNQRVFWRVYLPEDQNRPSEIRMINYSNHVVSASKLPEGIALILKPNTSKVQEGDSLRSVITFQNVTDIAFKDSLAVRILYKTAEKADTINIHISPLDANKSRNLEMNFGTLGKVGEHEISFLFNADKLPEEIYTNNEVHLSYLVIPDRIPPVLNVSVDYRQLADRDFVSAQPVIGIQVLDENKFLIRNDTSGIEVWLKEDCPTCAEQRLSLTNAGTRNLSSNDFRIWLKSVTPLKNGTYSLRVKAMDKSGNAAADYEIHFRVADILGITNAGVSPNPAAQWFRFYMELEGTMPEEKFVITINDLTGRKVKQIQAPAHTGTNEWFWQPENLPAGIYFYHIEVNNRERASSSGVITGLHGKLIWVR